MMLISKAELSVCFVLLWKTGKTKTASNYGVVLFYSAQYLSVDKLPFMLIKLRQIFHSRKYSVYLFLQWILI